MKYQVHTWDKKYDGVLYFVQRLEEMLFHYSDDIVKTPVHNTESLIREYISISSDPNTKPYHLLPVVDELRKSLDNDVIIREQFGDTRINEISKFLRERPTEAVHYLRGLFTNAQYIEWTTRYITQNIDKANEKERIKKGLRAWISSIIWAGYSSQYVYYHLITCMNKVGNPLTLICDFLNDFKLEKKQYRVYYVFISWMSQYKELLENRLSVKFTDDGYFSRIPTRNNSFVGYIDIEALDPFVAQRTAHGKIDIFLSFYLAMSNRRRTSLTKTAIVVDQANGEFSRIPTADNGLRAIEIEPHMELGKLIDAVVLNCQSKPGDTYPQLRKIINLHNIALSQPDLHDGFLNLWSILEVVSVGSDKESKIEKVLDSVLPILQNDFFTKYFETVLADLKHNLPHDIYRCLLDSITEEGNDIYKVMCFVFLDKYESERERCFDALGAYPNIRQKIFKMYQRRNNKQQLLQISEDYIQRVKWHIYRLYRVRNGIVHAGNTERNIAILEEHLHIYCDSIIIELLLKLAEYPNLQSIEDVLFEAKLLTDIRKQRFSNSGKMEEVDIHILTGHAIDHI